VRGAPRFSSSLSRHPELVSGSSRTCAPAAEDWMLKQVQHDGGRSRRGAGRAGRREGAASARGMARTRKRGRCCHRPRFGFRPGSCDPGRFPIRRPLEQAPTGFPISGPIEANFEESLCGSFARRLQFRRTPGKVGSALACAAASRFSPGCPTTASAASVPKDFRRFRGGGTQKLSSLAGRPLLTAKCQYGQGFRFAEADSACG
jgi:hypothetical protein